MIRPFKHEDSEHLIQLLKLNTPKYFDQHEEVGYITYLEKEVEDYFVVEIVNKIIGAGGINYVPAQKEAVISWDIFHPDFQGQGLGSELLQFRIKHVRKNNEFSTLVVRTSQLTYLFYQKNGFELERISKDYWAEGFDLYQMRMSL